MASKRLYTPEEVAATLTHWSEVDPKKLERALRARTETVALFRKDLNKKIIATALAVPPTLICPAASDPKQDFILNGKHRAIAAVLRRQPLLVHSVSTRQELMHSAPKASYGNLGIETVLGSYDERAIYEAKCKREGAPDIGSLITKNADVIRTVCQKLGLLNLAETLQSPA